MAAGDCVRRVFILSFTVAQFSSAANILIFYFPLFSHINGPANVGKLLQEQGHHVTIAIPPAMKPLLEERKLNLLLCHSLRDVGVSIEQAFNMALKRFFEGKSYVSAQETAINTILDKILSDERLYKDIRAHKPDLLILDSGIPARMLTVVAYKLNIPFIFIGQIIQGQFSRSPLSPSVVPSKMFDATDQMSFWQRISNTFIEVMLYYHVPLLPGTSSRYCSEKPDISIHELQAKALLWIEIQDGILEYNKPFMPNMKQVSHLLPLKRKPLPREFQFFMDNAKEGVVIVSFGSVLKSFPLEIFDKILAAFRQTKYNFVIRYPISNFSDTNQFLFSKWIPQFELLCHRNTRLFITHCGANGQQEAVYAGVPMIGFPLLNDQPHNAARIVGKGFGLRLDVLSFTVGDLVSAIEEAITNPGYKARTEKASTIIRSVRVPPVEEAAFWINHILTFGGDHLRSLGQNIPLWKYLGLDILAFCFLVWHIFLFIFIKMVCFFFYWCCQRKNKAKKE